MRSKHRFGLGRKAFEGDFAKGLRGIASEDLALRDLAARGWEIRERRLRTPFAEIDALAFDRARGCYWLIEVKTASREGFCGQPIGTRQLARLRRARAWLEAKLRAPVGVELALVAHDGRVQWIPDFFC